MATGHVVVSAVYRGVAHGADMEIPCRAHQERTEGALLMMKDYRNVVFSACEDLGHGHT